MGDFNPDAQRQRAERQGQRFRGDAQGAYASEDQAAVDDKGLQVIEKLRAQRLTRAAEVVEASQHEIFAYYAFPEEHWQRIRNSNPLERILREIKRRTKVVAALSDGNLTLHLTAARLTHIPGAQSSARRRLNKNCGRMPRPRTPPPEPGLAAVHPKQMRESFWTLPRILMQRTTHLSTLWSPSSHCHRLITNDSNSLLSSHIDTLL